MRSSFAATLTVNSPGPCGVQVKAPSPRRNVARRLKTSLPFGFVTFTSMAESFDTLKRIAAGSLLGREHPGPSR